jgi:peptide deformylase
MIRDIVVWPDERLTTKAEAVPKNYAPPGIVQDMIDTMRAAKGAGLAAPQIGVPLRITVLDTQLKWSDGSGFRRYLGDPFDAALVLVNPVVGIKSSWPNGFHREEGCLSLPGEWITLYRPNAVQIKAFDWRGGALLVQAHGLAAGAIFHELDHLDGKLIVDEASSGRRAQIKRRMLRLKNG